MKLYSVNSLPPEFRVQRIFDMIVHTGSARISSRAGGTIDDCSEGIRRKFMEMVPEEANAVIGVQISTSVVLYDIGGGGSIYLTFSGTPAVIDEE